MELKETNNSKKLIIGVSILFCTVILIIGGSIAYFTQSGIGDTGNIVSVDEVTLSYSDNKEYMRKELIPSSEEYAKRAYAIEGVNKCKDDSGYNICSVYQFTITNNANVAQEIIINMTPTLNTFTNLKFMLYEVDNGVSNEVLSTQPLIYNDRTTLSLVEDLILDNGSSKTYEIVYYILNLEEIDQTNLDANKNFGATISINSVTTGTYISNQEGASCWKTEPLEDGTNNYRLTEFYGIDNSSTDIEKVIEGCEEYVTLDESDKTFKVNIPSVVGNNNITNLGYNLFAGVGLGQDENGDIIPLFNNYYKIKEITIKEGITTIEDGYSEMSNDGKYGAAFSGIGFNIPNNTVFVENGVTVNLPSTLTYIGNNAFYMAAIKNINLPSNLIYIGVDAFNQCDISTLEIPYSVTTIGDSAFYKNRNLTSLTFAGSHTEVNDNNKLTIGDSAFYGIELTYIDEPLIIPARVSSVGKSAFTGDANMNENLKWIQYMGSQSTLDSFGPSWHKAEKVEVLGNSE